MFLKRLLPVILIALVLVLILISLQFLPGIAREIVGIAGSTSPQHVLSADYNFFNEFRISEPTDPEAERHLPAIAYNSVHDEYLVVWHNEWPSGHRDIYARRVSSSGKLLSWFAVSAGTNDHLQPDVVYNATNDEYLVVWMYDVNGDGSVYDIWGRIVAWNGAYQKPEFQIITWPNRSFWTPKAAWNKFYNEYMVVWNAVDATTTVPTDIAHAIFNSNGIKQHGAVIATADLPHQVDITYNHATTEYLVVWRRMQAPADGDILAARLGGFSGEKINPPGVITVSNTAQDQLRPAVATNQHNRYIVVWEHAFPGPCCDWDIKARELDNSGSLLASERFLLATPDDETYPTVAVRNGPGWEFVMVCEEDLPSGEAIWAWYESPNGFHVFPVAEAVFWDHETADVAMGKVSTLISYAGDTSGDPTIHKHIYGRVWVPSAVFLPLTRR